ncbi:MAG: CRISPR-associated protein Csx14 [Clostridia bacterium]|nr:CRISPR-associated protein Csx14 [Clostridia bacterium]
MKEAWPTLPFGGEIKLFFRGIPVSDVDTERALVLLYRALKDLVADYRRRGFRIHLNISGGRKPMGICALLVAQLLFGPEDRLWYLFSSPGLVESRAFLADPRAYKLLEIPVPLWTEAAAFLQVLARYEDPWAAVELQRRLRHKEETEHWQHFFFRVLTPAEQRVVKELVVHGLANKQIARKLRVSPRTVEHQLSSVYKKLRRYLGHPQGFVANRATLVAILAPLFREFRLEEVGESPDGESPCSSVDSERRC